MPPKKARMDLRIKEKPSASENDQVEPEAISDSEEDEEEEGGVRVEGVYIPPAPPAISSTGPRLIISYIVNTNFKSFAGTQILGPFHKGFNSIIGANGSGKSNVIDAMLFVFGYRGTKIRSKKISALLHKSENHRDIRSATVEVHFVQINDKDGGDFDKIPGSEIVISRTAFHNNSSFYTINGKRSQFKEVAFILKKHRIDLVHNKFVILQGEVEQIAMMKPKAQTKHETGMLEYLEDIIGTARYKKPLMKLEAMLDDLRGEWLNKINGATIIDKEREALRRPMEEAIDFLALENEHNIARNLFLQLKLLKATQLIENLKAEKKVLDEAMAEVHAKLNKFRAQKLAMQQEDCSREKKLRAWRKLKDQISDALAKKESAITITKCEIALTTKTRQKAIEAKNQEEEKLREYEKISEKNKKEIEELEVIAKKLKLDRERADKEVEEVLAGLQAETQGLQDKRDVLLAQLTGLRKTKDSVKAAGGLHDIAPEHDCAVSTASDLSDHIVTDTVDTAQEFEDATAESSLVQKEVDKLTAQIEDITGSRMKEAQKKLDSVTKKLDKVTTEITKLSVENKISARNSKKSLSKVQELTLEITEADNSLKMNEELLERLKEIHDNDETLKELSGKMKSEEADIKAIQTKIKDIMKEENRIRSSKIDEEEELKKKMIDATSALPAIKSEISNLKLNQIPFRPPVPDLMTYTSEELAALDEATVYRSLLEKHEQLTSLTPNLTAIKEFNEKDELYKLRQNELKELNEKREKVRLGFIGVQKSRLNEFMKGFTIIRSKLKETYKTITLAGDAELDFPGILDPFFEGVAFRVRPPHKSWMDISKLSGGEKTLCSLALVFAINYYKHSPLYAMDDIDAALDSNGVTNVGLYIKEQAKNGQYMVITLRSNMYELADLRLDMDNQ